MQEFMIRSPDFCVQVHVYVDKRKNVIDSWSQSKANFSLSIYFEVFNLKNVLFTVLLYWHTVTYPSTTSIARPDLMMYLASWISLPSLYHLTSLLCGFSTTVWRKVCSPSTAILSESFSMNLTSAVQQKLHHAAGVASSWWGKYHTMHTT